MATLSVVAFLTFFIIEIVHGNDVSESSTHYRICHYGARCVSDPDLELEYFDFRCKQRGPQKWCLGDVLYFDKINTCPHFNEEEGYAKAIVCKCTLFGDDPHGKVSLGCEFLAEKFCKRPLSYDNSDPKVIEHICENSGLMDSRNRSTHSALNEAEKIPCLNESEGENGILGCRYLCCRTFKNFECKLEIW